MSPLPPLSISGSQHRCRWLDYPRPRRHWWPDPRSHCHWWVDPLGGSQIYALAAAIGQILSVVAGSKLSQLDPRPCSQNRARKGGHAWLHHHAAQWGMGPSLACRAPEKEGVGPLETPPLEEESGSTRHRRRCRRSQDPHVASARGGLGPTCGGEGRAPCRPWPHRVAVPLLCHHMGGRAPPLLPPLEIHGGGEGSKP